METWTPLILRCCRENSYCSNINTSQTSSCLCLMIRWDMITKQNGQTFTTCNQVGAPRNIGNSNIHNTTTSAAEDIVVVNILFTFSPHSHKVVELFCGWTLLIHNETELFKQVLQVRDRNHWYSLFTTWILVLLELSRFSLAVIPVHS